MNEEVRYANTMILENDDNLSETFYNPESTKSDIINSGRKIIMKIYSDARKCDCIDSLRCFISKKQLNKRGMIQKRSIQDDYYHQQQQDNTIYVYIIRYRNGLEIGMIP